MIVTIPQRLTMRPYAGNTSLMQSAKAVDYYDPRLPDGGLTVPAGTVTDGASIPYGFRWLVGQPYAPYMWRAALLHDELYNHAHLKKLVSRKDSDDMFYELLLQDSAPPIRARLKWSGLRVGAWVHWRW